MMDNHVSASEYKAATLALKLSYSHLKKQLSQMSQLSPDKIRLFVKDKNALIHYTALCMRDPKGALSKYSDKIQDLLMIRSDEPLIRHSSASGIYINAVSMIRSSRQAASRLCDLHASVRFFSFAVSLSHKGISCMDKARAVIHNKMGSGCLSGIKNCNVSPYIDPSLRHNLEALAFGPFQTVSPDKVDIIASKRYAKILSPYEEILKNDRKPKEKSRPIPMENRMKQMNPKANPVTNKTLKFEDIYNLPFVTVDGHNKKTVNLSATNHDIDICPLPLLEKKYSRAKLDMMTSRTYIMNVYTDKMPPGIDGVQSASWLFKQENKIWKDIMRTSDPVKYRSGRIYFPDGRSASVPMDMQPYEMLHDINAAYSAVFPPALLGTSSSDWLIGQLHRSYISEGVARYRMGRIELRRRGSL